MNLIDTMVALANSSTSRVDLVVKGLKDGLPRGWFFDRTAAKFLSDRQSEVYSSDALRALAAPGSEQTYTLVPAGCGRRIGIDRDADGYLDRDELDFGSDPANPLSLATNTPPALNGPSGKLLATKGQILTLRFTATDADIPAQRLTFSLGPGAPTGTSINATNGVFTWPVPSSAGVSTNTITVIVSDSGKPSRTDSRSFDAIAIDSIVGSLRFNSNSAAISWNTIAGLSYRLQYKNDLDDVVWTDLPEMVASNTTLTAADLLSPTNKSRFFRINAYP